MPHRSFIAVSILLALLTWPRAVLSATITLDIEARVDGIDRMIIRDGTLQWDHVGFGSAVGRHAGNNWPTIISAAVDGVPVLDRVEWFPEWSARRRMRSAGLSFHRSFRA
jgi:hypothetical protein